MSFYCLEYGCAFHVDIDGLLKKIIVCAVEEGV